MSEEADIVALQAEDHTRALETVQQQLAQQGYDVRAAAVNYRALYAQATALQQQEDHVRAAPLLGQAADAAKGAGLAAGAVECYRRQAFCFLQLEQWQSALSAGDQAIEADRTHWHGWFARGAALRNLGRYEEAAASYLEALDRNPTAAHVAGIRANLERARQLRAQQQRLERLEQHRLKAAAAVSYRALYAQATALQQQQDFANAAPVFEQAAYEASEAGNAAIAAGSYRDQARCLLKLEQYKPALVASDKAIEADRSFWSGWSKRGIALAHLGRYEEAAASYQGALDRNPFVDYVAIQGSQQAGSVTQLRQDLQIARQLRVQQQQLPAEQFKVKGNAAYKAFFYLQAMEHYEAALAAAEPGRLAREAYLRLFRAAVHGDLSQCLLMLERFEEAKVHAEASLALAEPDSKVHGRSLDRLEKAETALAYKRLAFATALLSGGQPIESPLAELVERELLQSIAQWQEREGFSSHPSLILSASLLSPATGDADSEGAESDSVERDATPGAAEDAEAAWWPGLDGFRPHPGD